MKQTVLRSTGWKRDQPDKRDKTAADPDIMNILVQGQLDAPVSIDGEVRADLREWFSPVEDQLSLQSCTANAAVGMIEYFQRRIIGKHINVSRLYLYKMTRSLMLESGALFSRGDTGASNRDTMKAIKKYGVPPNSLWEYTDEKDKFDLDPPNEATQYARDYQNVKYYRLDAGDCFGAELKMQICANLVFGFPCLFGFETCDSIKQAERDGKIPYPAMEHGDFFRENGGHAVLAVGFDNNMKITNDLNNHTTTGAFLIRNSWGESWGDHGYGWLPYQYVIDFLTNDWWSIVNSDWIRPGEFLADRGSKNGKSTA